MPRPKKLIRHKVFCSNQPVDTTSMYVPIAVRKVAMDALVKGAVPAPKDEDGDGARELRVQVRPSGHSTAPLDTHFPHWTQWVDDATCASAVGPRLASASLPNPEFSRSSRTETVCSFQTSLNASAGDREKRCPPSGTDLRGGGSDTSHVVRPDHLDGHRRAHHRPRDPANSSGWHLRRDGSRSSWDAAAGDGVVDQSWRLEEPRNRATHGRCPTWWSAPSAIRFRRRGHHDGLRWPTPDGSTPWRDNRSRYRPPR